MPRRLKLKTQELGDLELQLIYQYGASWEPSWKPLQGALIASLLTVVSKEVWDHALAGWTRPLVQALGIPPDGALRKLPSADKLCEKRSICPYYHPKECQPKAKNMPWCFEPSGVRDPNARQLASELLSLWREGVYVLVVIDA